MSLSMMMPRALPLLLWAVASDVLGYRLNDHRVITRKAVAVFTNCYPELGFTSYEADIIVKGNLSEDYNLATKWLRNSHYYNPRKWVRTLYRDDAGYRIKYLVRKLQETQEKRIYILGKIVHFVQDVSSPPHVMPIVHGLKDGFEKFPLTQKDVDTLQVNCPRQQLFSPEIVLKEHALQTLAQVKKTAFATRDGEKYEFSWQLFWHEGLGSKFGYYGFFGNNFGQMKPIVILRHVYNFKRESFWQLKLQQMQQAIEATTASFYWYRHFDS